MPATHFASTRLTVRDTGAKPFVCHVCQRAFSRHDSLIRHDAIHVRKGDSAPIPRGPPAPAPVLFSPVTTDSFQSYDDESIESPLAPEAPPMPTQIKAEDGSEPGTDLAMLTDEHDKDYKLTWPECENLIDIVMAVTGSTERRSSYPYPQQLDLHIGGFNASLNATAVTKGSMLPPPFLDRCLTKFFDQFSSFCPVLPRTTFVFQEHAPPIILSAMAVGSLFLEEQGSKARGEMLWDLAHAALEASEQSLLGHRGPYDACHGVQVVLAILLCRLYGTLSSKMSIRESSRALSAAAYSRAFQCGLFEMAAHPLPNAPSIEHQDSFQEWRFWLARETQLRILLVHFIIDGVSAQMSGQPAGFRSTLDALMLPCSDGLFEAETAEEWLAKREPEQSEITSFRDLFSALMPSMGIYNPFPQTLSAFSVSVALAELQSRVFECGEDPAIAFGFAGKSDIMRALFQLYDHCLKAPHITEHQRLDLLLRWHTICLDLIFGTSVLSGALCHYHNIEQHVVDAAVIEPSELLHWPSTKEGRTALLHAIAIHDTAAQIRKDRAYAIHVPSSLFAAAAVYSVCAMTGFSAIDVPETIDWQDVLFTEVDPSIILGELARPSTSTGAREFIHGGSLSSPGTTRYLHKDIKTLRATLQDVSGQWGIAGEMGQIVEAWNASVR